MQANLEEVGSVNNSACVKTQRVLFHIKELPLNRAGDPPHGRLLFTLHKRKFTNFPVLIISYRISFDPISAVSRECKAAHQMKD